MSKFNNSVFHHLTQGNDDFSSLEFLEKKRMAALFFEGCSASRRIDYIDIALTSIKDFSDIFNKLCDLGDALLSDKEEQKGSYALKDALQTEFMLCLIDAMEEDIQTRFDQLEKIASIDEENKVDQRSQDLHDDQQEWFEDDCRSRAQDMNAELNIGSYTADCIDSIFK